MKVRDRYGRNQFGQSLLLARRLIQSGVPIVQANMGIVQSWDTHVDNWGRLKTTLLPWLDQSLAALVDEYRLVVHPVVLGRCPSSTYQGVRFRWAPPCVLGLLGPRPGDTASIPGTSDARTGS